MVLKTQGGNLLVKENERKEEPLSPLWYFVILFTAGLSSVVIALFMEGGVNETDRLQAQKQALKQSIESRQKKLRTLKLREYRLRHDSYLIESLARKKLGYGRPGEKQVEMTLDGGTQSAETPAAAPGSSESVDSWKK